MTNCFVAVGADSGILAGYFTFAASSIALDDLPEDETKKLPRYRTLPAGLIGRLGVDIRFRKLGVDIRFRKRGIGSVLLADAAKRARQATPAVFALLVDAKDDAAIAFYRHHGFAALQSEPRRLFLPVASAARLAWSNRAPKKRKTECANAHPARLKSAQTKKKVAKKNKR